HALATRLPDGRYVYASARHVWFFHPDGTIASDGALPGECEDCDKHAWGDALVVSYEGVAVVTRDGRSYTTLDRAFSAYSTDGTHALALGTCDRDSPSYRARTLCARKADGTTQLVRLGQRDAVHLTDGVDAGFVVSVRDGETMSVVLVDAETG